MKLVLTDRGAGLVLAVLGAAGVALATGFRAGFIADPIGPRAFPFGIFGLLTLFGLALAARGTGKTSTDRESVRRGVLLLAALIAYVALLEVLGFVVVTTLVTAFLGVLFGGRAGRSFVVSLAIALVLFVLFVYGFSVPLPVGSIFASSGAV